MLRANLLAHAARGSNGAPTDLSLRDWMASVHCTEDILRLCSYLEDQGIMVSPLAVHLVAYKVVGLDGLVLLHIEDGHSSLDVVGSGDNWHTL